MDNILIIANTILENNQELLAERVLEMKEISDAITPILSEEELADYEASLLESSLLDYMSFLSAHYGYPLDESITHYISSTGQRGYRKDRKTRNILANRDPDRNKIDRIVSQIKGSKTRGSHISKQTRGNKKRSKSMRKREGLSL